MAIDDVVEKAISDGDLPGCIMVAIDKSGNYAINKAWGKASLASDAKPLELDAVLQIASMTKLLTTISCLQIVEQGRIGLDDDIAEYVPELPNQGVLKSVEDDGKVVTNPLAKSITLRLLLTHSAGTSYDAWDPRIQKVKAAQGRKLLGGATMEERYLYPLIFQPGSAWQYSTGIDWAGRVLERVTGETLDAYMNKNVFPKVGIKDITFFPTQEQLSRLASLTTRAADGGRVEPYEAPFINFGAKDCFGGQGCYATMPDYAKVLHSILADDEKLLKKETAAQMFKPQLTPESRKALHHTLRTPALSQLIVGDFPTPDQYDWGLGGILVERDNDGRRKKGTLIWSGMANCFWFIDREAGICGVFGTQVLPPGDLKVEKTIRAFEFEANAHKSKL